jgi:hypothetical protein
MQPLVQPVADKSPLLRQWQGDCLNAFIASKRSANAWLDIFRVWLLGNRFLLFVYLPEYRDDEFGAGSLASKKNPLNAGFLKVNAINYLIKNSLFSRP